jgi:ATP-binding cassette subfamily B protein
MNITTIIISNRLTAIKTADIIYTIKDGKVCEKGTHEELLNKGGYYADIIRPQLTENESDKQNKYKEENDLNIINEQKINSE